LRASLARPTGLLEFGCPERWKADDGLGLGKLGRPWARMHSA